MMSDAEWDAFNTFRRYVTPFHMRGAGMFVTHSLRCEGHDASEDGTGHGVPLVASSAVRRLTPTECERLQGFPDGWTDVPYGTRNRTPDGPRYKSLGNSFTVDTIRWIMRRVDASLQGKRMPVAQP